MSTVLDLLEQVGENMLNTLTSKEIHDGWF